MKKIAIQKEYQIVCHLWIILVGKKLIVNHLQMILVNLREIIRNLRLSCYIIRLKTVVQGIQDSDFREKNIDFYVNRVVYI